MSDIAIRVEDLSKAYRIGLKEQQHETLVGAVSAFVRAPFRNFRELRNLSKFDDAKPAAEGEGAKGKRQRAEGQGQGVKGKDQRAEDSSAVLRPMPPAPADIFWALKDVSFEVKRGEAVGIIGRNGAGKSTLLKILARITEPTTGRATIHGRVGSLLEVGTGFHPDLTGRENIYLNGTILGMKRREVDARFDEIVDFSGVEKFIDTPVKRYSSGMRVRLAFAVAAHLEPEILIVDEVLAVGDAEFQKKCLGKMQDVAGQGRTVLFVSHNLDAVLSLCSRGIVLAGGCLTSDGPANHAVDFYLAGARQVHNGRFPHELWIDAAEPKARKPVLAKLEVLQADGSPASMIETWASVRFRFHVSCAEAVARGALVLEFRDSHDHRLVVLDSGGSVPLSVGVQCVDCIVPQFPLAAGDYIVGAGIAVGRNEWLWRNTNIGVISVNSRDVFGIGRPPTASRMAFAVPHRWDQEGRTQEPLND